jgi:hypothetical protein
MLAAEGGGGRARGRALEVPSQHLGEWQIQDDRHGRPTVASGDGDQLAARQGLDVRGVDHRQAPAAEPHDQDPVQQVEGVVGGRLGSRVIGDQGAQLIRREDLGRAEVAPSEGGLAAPGHADQDDQGVARDGEENEPTAGIVGGR